MGSNTSEPNNDNEALTNDVLLLIPQEGVVARQLLFQKDLLFSLVLSGRFDRDILIQQKAVLR